jgi:hypothetical protein
MSKNRRVYATVKGAAGESVAKLYGHLIGDLDKRTSGKYVCLVTQTFDSIAE